MHNRRELLAGIAGVTATVATRSWASAAHVQGSSSHAMPAFMYVGSFTAKDGGRGEGISVFRRESAGWTLIQLLKDLADPSYLIVDRQGRFLYSAHGDGTQATAYRIDQERGRLTIVNRQSTGGRNGVHLAIDATNRFLADDQPRHSEHGRQQPVDARSDHAHRSELGRSTHSPVRPEVCLLREDV